MGTSAAATSVSSTGGGAGAWSCARVEQPAAAQRAARTAAQTDSESRLLLIDGLMLWLLRKCCVILYCARKAGTAGNGFVLEGVQVVSFCSGWASEMGSFGNSSRRAWSLSNSATARDPEGAPWRSAWARWRSSLRPAGGCGSGYERYRNRRYRRGAIGGELFPRDGVLGGRHAAILPL